MTPAAHACPRASCRNVWLTSDQHLDINFNPASLLSVGDALAFVRTLEEEVEQAVARDPSLITRPSSGHVVQEAASGAIPRTRSLEGISAAVATAGSVMSRAPQKYLIQNQSGLRVYYWADGREGSSRSPVYCLENGVSENLRVAPASKRLSFVQFSHASAGSERMGATINLHFEGNWMPLKVRGGGLAWLGVHAMAAGAALLFACLPAQLASGGRGASCLPSWCQVAGALLVPAPRQPPQQARG